MSRGSLLGEIMVGAIQYRPRDHFVSERIVVDFDSAQRTLDASDQVIIGLAAVTNAGPCAVHCASAPARAAGALAPDCGTRA